MGDFITQSQTWNPNMDSNKEITIYQNGIKLSVKQNSGHN